MYMYAELCMHEYLVRMIAECRAMGMTYRQTDDWLDLDFLGVRSYLIARAFRRAVRNA